MAANPLIDDTSAMSGATAKEEPFPAPSKHATGLVDGVPTEITSMNFSDKIVVTLSQEGRLAQWVCSPRTIRYTWNQSIDFVSRFKSHSQLHRLL